MTMRPSCFSLLVASSALALGACAKRETQVVAGIRTQTLHFGNEADPAILDPHAYTLMSEWTICTSLFEGLVNLANDGTTILPGVAEHWDISEDGRVYTFHLRSNALWSNGDPITSHDFLESFRRMLDPAVGCYSPEYLYPISGARDYLRRTNADFSSVGVRAPDRQTIQFTLDYRYPYFLTTLSNSTFMGMPVHMASIEKFGSGSQRGGKWTLPGNLVSNGAFVLKEWRPNQVVTVARNERYWDAARVRLKEIQFHPAENVVVEERMYRAQQLHTTAGLPNNKLETYRASHAKEFRQTPLLHTSYLTFNCTRAPFSDSRVRRALALAIDRKRVTDAGHRGRATPARSLVRPGTGRFDPPEMTIQDLAEARRALAEARYPGGKGFPAVEFRITAGRTDEMAMAEALQQWWQQTLGINLPLRQMEAKTLVASLYAKDYELALSGYYYLDDPTDQLALGEKDGQRNYSGWYDPRFEQASQKLRQAKTDADRFAAFATMERALTEGAPYVPIFHLDRAHLVHPSVQGWRENPVIQIDWRELWLESR